MYPVSYRSFKHLLGETSLERKCRFIFGGGILVLVSISFYWYGQKTESLVIAQTNQTARILADMKVKSIHNKEFVGNSESAAVLIAPLGRPDVDRRPAQIQGRRDPPPRDARRPLRAVRPGEVPQVGLGGGGLPEGGDAAEALRLRRRHPDLVQMDSPRQE